MPRTRIFGIELDAFNMHLAVERVLGWVRGGGRCRYVVTPNVDHAVMYQDRDDLRESYKNASLVLADGAPVVLAANVLGEGVPERVAGSDLVPALFDAASSQSSLGRPLRVFLLGAADGVADKAADAIRARWHGVKVVGTYSPPLGFENDAAENEKILYKIAAARVDVLVIGLGAPKQELWISRYADRIEAAAALCVGATIDFLAGEKRRAPIWMRKTGLEWLHRVAGEPRRLLKRYFRDARIFPKLVWREWRGM